MSAASKHSVPGTHANKNKWRWKAVRIARCSSTSTLGEKARLEREKESGVHQQQI